MRVLGGPSPPHAWVQGLALSPVRNPWDGRIRWFLITPLAHPCRMELAGTALPVGCSCGMGQALLQGHRPFRHAVHSCGQPRRRAAAISCTARDQHAHESISSGMQCAGKAAAAVLAALQLGGPPLALQLVAPGPAHAVLNSPNARIARRCHPGLPGVRTREACMPVSDSTWRMCFSVHVLLQLLCVATRVERPIGLRQGSGVAPGGAVSWYHEPESYAQTRCRVWGMRASPGGAAP